MKVLLVEDHPDSRDAFKRLLRAVGCEVHTTATAAGAMAACKAEEFDLLICDIRLPDGDGWDLLPKLRQIHQVPAIALTGYGAPSDHRRSAMSGFDEHLTKPVPFDSVLRAIKRVTGQVCSKVRY